MSNKHKVKQEDVKVEEAQVEVTTEVTAEADAKVEAEVKISPASEVTPRIVEAEAVITLEPKKPVLSRKTLEEMARGKSRIR